MTPPAPGTLFVVATPIGNLEDITLRALRILKEVDLVAAEDTRRTLKLLTHYDIHKPLVSLREHNEVRESARLVARLAGGAQIALVSDAGTPAIADPGARLVRAARQANVRVVPIPGPSAITAALSVSGLVTTEFAFMGFPPATSAARRAWFKHLAAEPRAVVFFESPHRIARLLSELPEYMVDRPIHIHREITKLNEEYVFRPNIWPVGDVQAKGEFAILIESRTGQARPDDYRSALEVSIGHIADSDLLDRDALLDLTAAALAVSRQAAVKFLKKRAISIKQQNRSAT